MKSFLVLVALAWFACGCSSFATPLEPSTLTPVEGTPASTPVEPLEPVPTLDESPTPTAPPDPGSGVFSPEQRERLYQASLKYLAPTDGDAVNVALALKFVKGADVSNMCGPLAITILRDAGFVPADVDNHDFWLLNPRTAMHRAVLERVFPPDQYTDTRFDQPIDQFDFKAFPLQTGDFLYIYAGHDGSFEHMLVVTRVDETGRVYTVTNVHTDSFHFEIAEKMLYDPAQPGVGQLYDWTNKENYRLGITGLGGFEVWRRVVPLP